MKLHVLFDADLSAERGHYVYFNGVVGKRGRLGTTENIADAEFYRSRADAMRSEAYQLDRNFYPMQVCDIPDRRTA